MPPFRVLTSQRETNSYVICTILTLISNNVIKKSLFLYLLDVWQISPLIKNIISSYFSKVLVTLNEPLWYISRCYTGCYAL